MYRLRMRRICGNRAPFGCMEGVVVPIGCVGFKIMTPRLPMLHQKLEAHI
jgi:hypothetical protein